MTIKEEALETYEVGGDADGQEWGAGGQRAVSGRPDRSRRRGRARMNGLAGRFALTVTGRDKLMAAGVLALVAFGDFFLRPECVAQGSCVAVAVAYAFLAGGVAQWLIRAGRWN